jgi:hypothetical protein
VTHQPRWPVVAGALLGVACAAVGVASLVHEAHDTHPLVTATWVVGLALAHDLLLVPVVLVVGTVVHRVVPGRTLVVGGLIVSGVLGLVAWPLVRGYGRSAGNPSILPRDYGHGLVVALAATWAAVLALHVLRRLRRGPQPSSGS